MNWDFVDARFRSGSFPAGYVLGDGAGRGDVIGGDRVSEQQKGTCVLRYRPQAPRSAGRSPVEIGRVFDIGRIIVPGKSGAFGERPGPPKNVVAIENPARIPFDKGSALTVGVDQGLSMLVEGDGHRSDPGTPAGHWDRCPPARWSGRCPPGRPGRKATTSMGEARKLDLMCLVNAGLEIAVAREYRSHIQIVFHDDFFDGRKFSGPLLPMQVVQPKAARWNPRASK